jgi:long-subunit acyl-CoA synthetase (AMP-forming)
MAVLVPDLRIATESPHRRETLSKVLAHELDRVNSHLDPHEQLRFLVICHQPWTADNGLLTPTLKVRRTTLEERFNNSFTQWEQSKERVLWQGFDNDDKKVPT